MNGELIRGLTVNTTLLLTISIIYSALSAGKRGKRKSYDFILGLLIGIVGILLMINTVDFAPGIIFDTRSILVSVSGLFFGFIPTVTAVSLISIFRIVLGGAGTFAGIVVTLTTASFGLLWSHFRMHRALLLKMNVWLEFYLFGLLTHIIMLVSMLTLPHNMIVALLKEISLPILLIYPIGSLLLCMLMSAGLKSNQTKSDLEKSEASYKNLYHEFQGKQMLLLSLLNSIPDLIFYKDSDSVYLGCNRAFEQFVGKKEAQIIGRTDFELFDKQVAAQFREMDISMMNQKSQRLNEELVTYPDGSKVYLDTLKTPFYDFDGNVLGLIGISRDITERKKKEKEIIYLNYHDVLTGLYNRTFFDEERKRLDTKHQLPLSVIIGDINGLKLINDAFGHAEGDKLLVAISKILRSCCRAEDIIARTGGDEFSILLPITNGNSAKTIYDRIKKICEEYATKSDKEVYYPSISLGYSTKTEEDEPLDTVMKVAEENMYRRKLLEHKSLHSSIISSIKTTMFEKSNETEEHAERLAILSKKLGQALNLSEEELVALELVSTLHDIGKISIDQNILTKPGPLSADEWVEMKKHPEVGFRIAQTVPELKNISEYILCHHERWDGSGYPQGLIGKYIPLLSRILAVVDSYDAMTQDRFYRKALSRDAAIAEIKAQSGTQFDPEVARIFVEKVLNGFNG